MKPEQVILSGSYMIESLVVVSKACAVILDLLYDVRYFHFFFAGTHDHTAHARRGHDGGRAERELYRPYIEESETLLARTNLHVRWRMGRGWKIRDLCKPDTELFDIF